MLTVRASKIGEIRGKLVLDFGAGAGRHAFWAVTQGANVAAVDISFDEIENAPDFFKVLASDSPGNGIGFAVQASGMALPFRDGLFDIVIASEVFEHIADDTAVMCEIARVMKIEMMLANIAPPTASARSRGYSSGEMPLSTTPAAA